MSRITTELEQTHLTYTYLCICISSVHFSRLVMSDSLRPHESQHARPPCPSPIPGVQPNSCALSRLCHPAISPSVVPFSSCPQCLPASGSFPVESTLCMRWPEYWSFSLIISPSKEHPGLVSFRMDWLDLLAVQGCHPTSSSPVVPFSSCPQSFPASGSFQMSQLFTSGGQSIGVSASTSVLPMNTQD